MCFMLLINSLPASPVCYPWVWVCLARSRPAHVDIPEDWTLCKQPPDRWRVRERADWDGSQCSDGPPRVFQQLWAEELYVADAHRSLSLRGSYRLVETSNGVWMLVSLMVMTGFSHRSFCPMTPVSHLKIITRPKINSRQAQSASKNRRWWVCVCR